MTTLMSIYDATHANIAHLPAGQKAAGYTTGSGGVPWTAADWRAHPDAVRFDQDPAASDTTADVLDVERGAATIADVVPWVQAARTNRAHGNRVMQRWPCIYASQSNITPIANQLKAAGITSGCFLWIANWSMTEQQADTDVLGGSGPWPVIAVQFRNTSYYDVSVMSRAWFADVTEPAMQEQYGKVVSLTTHGVADVISADAGRTWKLAYAAKAGPPRQKGVVVSFTTNGKANVTTTDGGETWEYA